ncbi:ABC transporter ATP-binding protein [Paenibacillus antri]|uniref:ABC transporter ATP-binding protein n=1 Tax=Paenibacillus antri TaxID=2582848 RepID=A0A5R9G841_9BACL|nr:ABC transporter ATP-binding protein [Paenibacillus antri]TLS51239.1 ABC transporter ATP-binding protein [Paenibacillus antri]
MRNLQLERVAKNFGAKRAVNGISFTAQQGEIFGLIGANGAGKTTTMRMVLGLIYPDEGKISYGGQPYSQAVKEQFGYLPEERGLYPKVKVSDQILYLAELRGMRRADADKALKSWLERFGVPENYGKKVEELSKGNQQKIQFIAAVIHNPHYLILDEAFSGLDPVNVELLKETIASLRDEGKTILFSSHRMEHVEELCRNVCVLDRSNAVLQGSLRDIKSRFPKERVMLTTERPMEGLERLEGVTAVKRLANGYDIRIADESAAGRVLRLAADTNTVTRFELMEPSLNDIFIKTIGGSGKHE